MDPKSPPELAHSNQKKGLEVIQASNIPQAETLEPTPGTLLHVVGYSDCMCLIHTDRKGTIN